MKDKYKWNIRRVNKSVFSLLQFNIVFSLLQFNMQITWYLSASLYKSMYACLFSIHCFYVYCGYEKRSISEVVKDFNNNVVLAKWDINIMASAILENYSAGLSVRFQTIWYFWKACGGSSFYGAFQFSHHYYAHFSPFSCPIKLFFNCSL
jgi:hypothetical protein